MTDRVFMNLITFIEENNYLRELDITWSGVKLASYEKLIDSLATNNKLSSLTLKWNCIMEKQEQCAASRSLELKKEQPMLTPRNSKIIKNLSYFIKFNQRLVFLDLSNCGLNQLAIIQIVRACKKAVSLKSINLSGNQSSSSENKIEETIVKIRKILGSAAVP